MVRTNQGGSILNFVILGGVMALLLIGGAYLVRHNLAPADAGPRVATTQDDKAADQAPKDDQPAPAQDKSQGEAAKPQPSVTPDKTDGNKNEESKSAVTPAPAPAQPGSGDASSDLPSTGPSGVLIGGIMLSCLVALSVAYAQSRRLWASL